MRILYITNGINGSGGLERVLSVKASFMADQLGYTVHLAGLNGGNENPFFSFSSRIRFHNINVGGSPLSYIKQYARGIKDLVKEVKPDIISVCDDGLKGFFVPRLLPKNFPIIYERHVSKLIELEGKGGITLSTKLKWSLMERLAAKFKRFVVLTNGNTNEWSSLKNITVIGNPLSFIPNEPSILQAKRVICVGKISYQKGQDLLLKAWELVQQKHPDWELDLYGKRDDRFLTMESNRTGIHYHPPVKDIEQAYRKSSLYVLSSRYEGFGMVLIEAMAFGLPCIAFNCNYGPSDIIQDQHNGLLVPTEDVVQLASSINRLIENESLRNEMGKNARASIDRYTPEHIMLQWDQLFKSVIDESTVYN